MAITVVGAQYSSGLTGALPAGTAAGDLLVAHFTAGEHTAQTGPGGWTQINQVDAASPSTVRASTWYVVRDATTPALTWAGPASVNASVEIVAYRGVNPTTPIGASSMVDLGFVFVTSRDAPSIVIAAIGNWLWSGMSFTSDPGTVVIPAGMTSRYNRPSGDWFVGADEQRTVTGATGTRTFNFSTSTTGIGFSVELQSATSGTTTRVAQNVSVPLSITRRPATPITVAISATRRIASPINAALSGVAQVGLGRLGIRGTNVASRTVLDFSSGSLGLRGRNTRVGGSDTITRTATPVTGALTLLRRTATPVTAALALLRRIASPITATLTVIIQSAAPIADGARGGWTTQSGGTTNLFATVDETAPDDADYVQSLPGPPLTLDIATVKFPLPGARILKYRYSKDAGAGSIDLLVELLQDTTVVQSWTHFDIPTGWTEADQTITASITDYSVLHVRLTPIQAALPAPGTPVAVSVTGSEQWQVMDNSGVDAEPWILAYSGPDWMPMAERMISEGRMRWWGVDPYGNSDWITSTSQLNNTFTDAFYATDPHWQYAWQVLRYLCDRTDMVCITFTGEMPHFGTGDGWHIDTAQEANTAAALGSAIDYARRVLHLPIKLVSPMNECDMGRPGPEGPDITPAQYIRVSKALLAYLDARGYTDVMLVPPNIADIGSVNTWFGAFLGDATIMPRVRALTVHIYRTPATGGGAYGLIQGSGWPSTRFWYSEFGQTNTDGDMGAPGRVTGPADEWVYARQLTHNQLDLLDNGASSTSVWNAWDAQHHHTADQYSFYGLWGYTNEPNGTPGGTWYAKKRYFTTAQITRFIQPGWKMVTSGTSDPGLYTVVFSDGAGGLTIVGQNMLSTPAQLNVSLTGVGSISLMRISYTTETLNLVSGGTATVTGGVLSATVPADCFFSITTLTDEQTHTRPAWPITVSLS